MFEYDQAAGRSKPDGGARRLRDRGIGPSVLYLIRLLLKRAIWIVGAALACACIAVLIGKSLTPRYAASTQLYIDPRELQLVERELTPRSQDLTGLAMVVESQARLITSNNVLLKVIGDLDLEQDPEFGGKAPPGFLSELFGSGSGSSTPNSTANERADALDTLRRHINVKRTDRTFIVDVETWSRDPAKAAAIANAVAASYMEESKESQAAAARRATTDLSGRLKELQQRLRLAENNLAVYKSSNNFLGTQDTQVSDQQLLSSTQRLSNAQAAVLDAKARYNQIEASRKNATDPGAMAEALQSPTIAALRTQFAETRRRQAELQSELGPLHPAVRTVDKQVEDIRRNIGEEIARFVQSAKNDLTRAQDLEAALTKSLNGQKRQSVDLVQASVKLRELERDVEASRTIYQAFLKRSRETEEQESLNTSSARIIGEATPPQRRVFPPGMSLLAMIGFVLGGLAAVGCILVFDSLLGRGESKPKPILPRRKDAPRESVAQPVASQPIAPPPTARRLAASPEPLPQAAATAASRLRDPLYFRLQETDVLRTLNGIFPLSGPPDIVRLGWPTLNAGPASTHFADASLRLLALAKAQARPGHTTTLAVVSLSCDEERTTVALNIALAVTQSGARVLLLDADRYVNALSIRLNSRAANAGLGVRDRPVPEILSGVTVQKVDFADDTEILIKALNKARRSGLYDLIVLDGPAIPAIEPDRQLLGSVYGILAVIPAAIPSSEHLNKTITALPGGGDKVLGVVFSELLIKRDSKPAHQYA